MAFNRRDRALLARLEAAVASMPELPRTIFLLLRLEGLDYRQAGKRLGLSVHDVERNFADAMAHLTREMDRDGID